VGASLGSLVAVGIPTVRLEKTWAARDVGKEFGNAVGDILLQFRWSPTRSLPELEEHHPSARLEIWSGSQRTLWLVGTWLASDTTLPLTGAITRTQWTSDDRVQQITVELQDNIGFGLMDPYTAHRFRRVFRRFASAIEAAIRENSAAYSEGRSPPPLEAESAPVTDAG
jgi:hypothetical protein